MGWRETYPKSDMVREWIVFALCLGLGGHIALAVVLHAPDRWPWTHAGLYGLVLGVGVYVVVQLTRTLWRAVRGRPKEESLNSQG